jgi:hypothetical protein
MMMAAVRFRYKPVLAICATVIRLATKTMTLVWLATGYKTDPVLYYHTSPISLKKRIRNLIIILNRNKGSTTNIIGLVLKGQKTEVRRRKKVLFEIYSY